MAVATADDAATTAPASRSLAALVLQTVATAALLLALVDAAFVRAFPEAPRLADNFSAAYLTRELRGMRGEHPVVVLGDSALWGYGIAPDLAAVTRLRRSGRPWVNLAYEGGSPANTFAMLRVLHDAGVVPKAVVFNVNLKEFNVADSAYQTLYPAVERLAWNALAPDERARLHPVTPQTLDARLNRAVESIWQFYAMRSDVREALFGAPDAAQALASVVERASGTADRKAVAHRPTSDKFEGTYDLSPLDDRNVSVFFLNRIARELRAEGVPAYGLLTPTNHTLLHDYVDVPEYRAQLAFVTRVLARSGVRTIDYDRSFGATDFIDNDHLTAAGNARLATLLARDVPE